MRKIVNDTFMTLNGDISNMQDWHFEFTKSEEFAAAAQERLFASDGQQYNFELAGTEVHGNGLILLTTRR